MDFSIPSHAKNGIFETSNIHKHGIFEIPAYKNGNFETPIQKNKVLVYNSIQTKCLYFICL